MDTEKLDKILKACVSALLSIVIILLLVVMPVLIVKQYKTKARVFNQINGTTFTASDFFFAEDQINTFSSTINVKIK